jgi:hypothetical protein
MSGYVVAAIILILDHAASAVLTVKKAKTQHGVWLCMHIVSKRILE